MPDDIKTLSNETIKLIKSSQVITSVASVIKELLENSLDAEASIISLKLEKYGYDKLEVKDNGKGITVENMKIIAKPHTTSKISAFEDLGSLSYYGFRGEALSSLCSLADVIITTKPQNESLAYKYEFDSQGEIIQSTVAVSRGGTTVSVHNLFKNIPVRKQYHSNLKRRKDDLKKVENLVIAFGIIRPKLYISFVHDGTTIFQKNSVGTCQNAILSIFRECSKKMKKYHKACNEASLDLWLPDKKFREDQACTRCSTDRLFVFVNDRPVNFKTVEKLIKKYFCIKGEGNYVKYPIGVVIIKVIGNSVDVNLEPNKNRVCLQKETQEIVLELLESILLEMYGTSNDENSTPCTLSSTQIKSANKLQECAKMTTLEMTSCLGQSDYLTNNKMSLLDEDADDIFGLEQVNIMHSRLNERSVAKDCRTNKENDKLVNPVEQLISPVVFSDSKTNLNSSPSNATLSSIFDIEDEFTPKEIIKTDSNFVNSPTVDYSSRKSGMMENESYNSSIEKGLLPTTSAKILVFDETNNENMVAQPNKIDTTRSLNDAVLQKSRTLESLENFSISRDEWSKGHIMSSGSNIQNVHILSGPKRSISSLESSNIYVGDGFHREDKSNSSKKPKLNTTKSPIGLNVKKPSSAFSLFAKDVRHDIFEKNPGVNFTFVAQEISKRWKEMDCETKYSYEQKSLLERNEFSTEKRGKTSAKIHSMADISMNSNNSVSCLQRLIAPHTPQMSTMVQNTPFKCPWKNKQFVVPFNLKDVQEKCIKQCNKTVEDGAIGLLQNNSGWLYCNEGKICCLNSWRLNEIILYESLMQNYEFNSTAIHEPITLNESLIGKREWNVLISLKKEMNGDQNWYTVIDRRIALNGFKVILYCNSLAGILYGEIVSLTSTIKLYGLHDLLELLGYLSRRNNAILSECRPLKLKNWIKDECIRINRSSPNITDVKTLSMKIKTWKELSNSHDNICLHSEPIIVPLIDIK